MGDIERIEQKIDSKFESFQKFLTGLSNKLAVQGTEIDTCKGEKNEIKETLHGNGKDGLVLKVDRLETKMKITKMLKTGFWNNTLTVFLCVGVVASIIVGVIGILW